jgi:putative Holliday junction resolvase
MARLLGIDPGSKRCGVALTDREESMAFPRPALAANDQLVERLRSLVDEERVELVVIGRPVALSGNETASTQQADGLYELLVDALAPRSRRAVGRAADDSRGSDGHCLKPE